MPGTSFPELAPGPDVWRQKNEWRYYAHMGSLTAFLLLGPLCLAIIAYATDSPIIASYLFAFAVIGVQIWLLGYRLWYRHPWPGVDKLTTGEAENGSPGLKIPMFTAWPRRILVLIASLAVLLGAGAVHAAVVGHDSAYLWGTLALYFVLGPTLLTRRRFFHSYVLVTEEGIYHRGWTFRSFLRWSDVEVIFAMVYLIPYIAVYGFEDAQWEHRQFRWFMPLDKPTKFLRRDGKRRRPGILLGGRSLAVSPAVVLATLGFYLENANSRDELRTGAALGRARAANFPNR